MNELPPSGYRIWRGVFPEEAIEPFRLEADRVASGASSICVRHLGARSILFRDLALSEKLMGLLPEGFVPVRSILFDKTPGQNWPVAWHQDLTIAVAGKVNVAGYGPWSVKENVVHVQPPEALLAKMITLRIHLDETSSENGALMVIPMSHRRGKISGDSLGDLVDGNEVVCECGPGDVLLMSPLILHSSGRSQNPSRRGILHFEYAPCHALSEGLTWYDSLPGKTPFPASRREAADF